MNAKYFLFAYILLIGHFVTGCKEFLTVNAPPDQLIKNTVFNDDRSAEAALAGIYSSLATGYLSANMQIAAGLCADELGYTGSDITLNQFYTNNIQAENSGVLSCWRELYSTIYHANAALEGLQTSGQLSDSTRTRLEGEAKFIRAFCYFYLVNLWGDVPLVTGTDYQVNQSIPRISRAEIYKQIVKDLEEAREALSDYNTASERVRPGADAASTLLARVHLYQANWQAAEAEATSVMSSGSYSLSDAAHAFLKDSPETVWQLMAVNPSFSTNIGQQLIPWFSSFTPNYILPDHFLQAFEEGDLRKVIWTNANTVGETAYYFPYKYKLGLTAASRDEYLVVFRLAELYLIRAEARARQHKPGAAEEDLNSIRLRAGLPETAAETEEVLLAAIAQERRVELFAEWGHRWLDLKRTSRADEVLGPLKGADWRISDALWPIPHDEMQVNPRLTQNEGYQ